MLQFLIWHSRSSLQRSNLVRALQNRTVFHFQGGDEGQSLHFQGYVNLIMGSYRTNLVENCFILNSFVFLLIQYAKMAQQKVQ